ncbi:MAG TPA: hypothetical protein VD838_15350, partial [Anaeromyxobacteraceae bacterium]|nr:hypothetical protein [Anaeromyxobacteraceae bacterium]
MRIRPHDVTRELADLVQSPLLAKLSDAEREALLRRLVEMAARFVGESGLPLRGRSLPRAREVTVTVAGAERKVATGTPVGALLPEELDGALVVAALLGRRPVPLDTPIVTDTHVEPLTVAHWEGRQIYARSLGLLLLEAAHRAAPGVRVRLARSRGIRQAVEVDARGDRAALADRIAAAME